MGYKELIQILYLGTKLMNSVVKSREGKAEWGEGFTGHRMITQRRRREVGGSPVCPGQRDQAVPADHRLSIF